MGANGRDFNGGDFYCHLLNQDGSVMDRDSLKPKPYPLILKTSSEIISEARAAMATKPVNTKRPFTPIERQRTLFGAVKAGTSRPPSSISLRHLQFQDAESVRLPPLRTSTSLRNLSKLSPWRLPELGKKIHSSLTNLPEEVEPVDPTSSLVWPSRPSLQRETHSSPQERTEFSGPPKPRTLASLNAHYPKDVKLKSGGKNRKKYGSYRLLGRKDLGSSLSIQEDDEPQTLTIHSSVNKATLSPFSPPQIFTLTDGDVTVEENIINEKKVTERLPFEDENSLIKLITLLNDLSNSVNTGDLINEDQIISLLRQLYNKMKSNEFSRLDSETQNQILKTLYKFVETASDKLLVQISKVILALRVNRQNLSAVTKLIFKVSRNDTNDNLFLDEGILEVFVEALGRASPLDDAEACIYGYGALKFLTMNQQLLYVAMKMGLLELMVLHMKIINNARMELISIPEQTSHALFQLTGALRNVASEDMNAHQFVETGAINELCTIMEIFCSDLDLVSNIARTLSILTTHDDSCEAVINHENSFRSIVKVFEKYPGRQDIIVRFGYALGNIISKSDSGRVNLFHEPKALTTLMNLLENYLDKDLEQMKSRNPANQGYKSPEWASDGSIEDVLIKLIRIVANMSMNPEVGTALTCNSYDAQNRTQEGGQFVDILLMVLRRKSVTESEELVMSVLSTLNNLSYYALPDNTSGGPFGERQIEIAQVLSTLLLTKNEESMIEVNRVLGNLTRSKEVRDYLLEIGGVSQLVRCLEYENKELLFTATGVLVNLMADWDKRLAFKESNGIQRLITVLRNTEEGDWRLASLVCQALWNFCIDSTHLYAALGIQSTNCLLTVLVDLLDEEKLFGVRENQEVPDEIADNPEYKLWEQFANVATNLLEKIEQYLESMHAFNEETG